MTKKRSAAECTSLAAHELARRELRAFWERQPTALAHLRETMRRTDVEPLPMPVLPGYEWLTCGARTRAGGACQSRKLWPPNYRCRHHGGLSGRRGAHDVRACARNSGEAPASFDFEDQQ